MTSNYVKWRHNSSEIRHVFCFNCLTEERLACFLQIYKAQWWGQFHSSDFSPDVVKCDNFGLYRLLRSGFFLFNFWFPYKWRHLLKFVCFLFFKKCDMNDENGPFARATNCKISVLMNIMRDKVGCAGGWREGPKSKEYNSKAWLIRR